MSKRQYLFVIALLFLLYNSFTWQHLITHQTPEQTAIVRLYYAGGLVLFLSAVFFTYLLERKFNLSRLATCLYIVLLISGAPFLYKLLLYIILNSVPTFWH